MTTQALTTVDSHALYIVQQTGKFIFPLSAKPSPELARTIVRVIPRDGREHSVAVAMNAKGDPLAVGIISSGSVDCTMLEPRDVYTWALTVPCVRYVGVAHNHPSGHTEPSGPDAGATAAVWAAGRLLKLDLLWSLVVTHENESWSEVPLPRGKGEQGGQGGGGAQGDDQDTRQPDKDVIDGITGGDEGGDGGDADSGDGDDESNAGAQAGGDATHSGGYSGAQADETDLAAAVRRLLAVKGKL